MDEAVPHTMPLPPDEMANVDMKVFGQADVLTNAEVAILLERIIAQKSGQSDLAHNPAQQHNITKMKEVKAYVDRFVGATNTDVATQVRHMLQEHKMYGYELGLVANLSPQNVDEAQALVPSLKDEQRFSADELDSMLQDMQRLQAFT